MIDAFFEQLDETRFRSQEHTRGPWDAEAQHAGPPAALLGGELERELDGPVARVTFEILRPVPLADLTVETEMLRPGRNVKLAAATLSDEKGPVLLARGWTIRREEQEIPEDVLVAPDPIPGPDEGTLQPFFSVPFDVGYHTAMDVRFLEGGFTQPGPAVVWMRPRFPIIGGRETTPLQRVLIAADSGNGVSALMDARTALFINTDLTVHLHRHPRGEWVSLDAATALEPDGVGLASSLLRDQDGVIGRSLQSLMVAAR